MAYARHRKLFTLSIEDTEATGGHWGEVLRNEEINSAYEDNVLGERNIWVTDEFHFRAAIAFSSIVFAFRDGDKESRGV